MNPNRSKHRAYRGEEIRFRDEDAYKTFKKLSPFSYLMWFTEAGRRQLDDLVIKDLIVEDEDALNDWVPVGKEIIDFSGF